MCTHVHVGFILGNVLHRHRPTKELQTGPSTRRGRHVPLRGRCVSCYALAPVPTTGSRRKTKMQDGRSIPNVTYACDICRVLLCKNCFWNVYDHRQGGKPCDMIVVRWIIMYYMAHKHVCILMLLILITNLMFCLRVCEYTRQNMIFIDFFW